MAEQSWDWHFDHPPEAVWRVLADTARFNEAAGFPKHAIEERPNPDGTVTYIGRAKLGPFALEWEDVPVDWVAPHRFVHRRLLRRGPLRELTAKLELVSHNGGTRAHYTMIAEPRGLLGRLLLVLGLMRASGRTFGRMSAQAREHLDGLRDEPFVIEPTVDPGGRARAEAAAARLDAAHSGGERELSAAGLGSRLADYVLTGPELDVEFLRPLRLARRWGVPERTAVELCLRAVREGLLGMQWVLLCPRCRGAKVAVDRLADLPDEAHCGSCNIGYGRSFAHNVELTFRPVASIRQIDRGEFCLFGPMSTPQVRVQQHLEPGESRDIECDFDAGPYRLRTLHPGGECEVDWDGGAFPEMLLDEAGVRTGAPSPEGRIRLRNAGAEPRTAVIESRVWAADALTAHRATTLQAFRDLFGEETLKPGDGAEIDRIALLFTDLRGSTALYERVGDVPAYGLVRDHFDYLARRVRRHDGAVVKTIGDAVMAAFADPAAALAAALDIQRGVADFSRDHGGDGIAIRAGIHAGPVMAVTLNGRLDYFGTTVNLAARLEGQSQGGDIVLSEAVAADPAAAALLDGLPVERETAPVRGLAAPVSYRRVRVAGEGQSGAPSSSPLPSHPRVRLP